MEQKHYYLLTYITLNKYTLYHDMGRVLWETDGHINLPSAEKDISNKYGYLDCMIININEISKELYEKNKNCREQSMTICS